MPLLTFALVAAGLAIIYLFPLLTKSIPSPLVTIIVLTALIVAFGWDVRTVGDMGELPDTLPVFLIPDIPLNFETLQIIFPYSVAVAVVGLLESLMTQQIVDDLTDTSSDRNQECIGQGIANTATGFHRWHGRMCDDRPVHHQRQIRRTRTALGLYCRNLSACSWLWCLVTLLVKFRWRRSSPS